MQDQERDLQSFLRLVESVDASQRAASMDFRALVMEHLIPQRITAHLLSRFSTPTAATAASKRQSSAALAGEVGEAHADDSSAHESSSGGGLASRKASAVLLLQQRSSGAVLAALQDEVPVLDPADPAWGQAVAKRGACMGLQLLSALVHGHQVRAVECSHGHGVVVVLMQLAAQDCVPFAMENRCFCDLWHAVNCLAEVCTLARICRASCCAVRLLMNCTTPFVCLGV